MKRREFIVGFGSAAAWPVVASAQRLKQIGALMSLYQASDNEGIASANAFAETLSKLGWDDGRNVRIDYRWPGGDPALINAAAAELVKSQPDVFIAAANPAVAELHRLAGNAPIVFTRVVDPVGSGFVANLAHPGGSITGFQASDAAVGGKWVEVLRTLDPSIKKIAIVYGSDSEGNIAFLQAVEVGSKLAAAPLVRIDIHKDVALDAAFETFSKEPHGGLIVVPHPWTTSNRKMIFALAARYRLPAIYGYRFFAADGGLASYGPDQIDQWRGAASYVDRILRGEKPGDLPVQAPTKYELVVNLKSAKGLGLPLPAALLARADEVIE